jgi:ATP-dependent DNA helicase PIF1
MANKAAIECVDQLLQVLMETTTPFGGKVLLALGDFRQVAPVVRGSVGEAATFQSSVRSSYLWPKFRILRLSSPIRTASDPEYSDWIDRIGEGYEQTVSLSLLQQVESVVEAKDFLFPPDILSNPNMAVRRSFLSPLNKLVDEFNDLILDQLPGEESMSCQTADIRKQRKELLILTRNLSFLRSHQGR